MYIHDEREVCRWSEARSGLAAYLSHTPTRSESKLIYACVYFAHTVCKTTTSRTQNKHEKASSHRIILTVYWHLLEMY